MVEENSNGNTLKRSAQLARKPQTPIFQSLGYTASLDEIVMRLVSKSFLS